MDREFALGVVLTLLAVALYIFMGARVGTLRGIYGVRAPAMTGHPQFERASRVHLNTGEQYVAFIPLLWMATLTFHTYYWLPAGFGVAFLLARVVYMVLYTKDPESRVAGAFLTIFSQLGLFVLAVIGLVQNWPHHW